MEHHSVGAVERYLQWQHIDNISKLGIQLFGTCARSERTPRENRLYVRDPFLQTADDPLVEFFRIAVIKGERSIHAGLRLHSDGNGRSISTTQESGSKWP